MEVGKRGGGEGRRGRTKRSSKEVVENKERRSRWQGLKIQYRCRHCKGWG